VEFWDVTDPMHPRRVAALPGVAGGIFVRDLAGLAPDGTLLVTIATKMIYTNEGDAVGLSYSSDGQDGPMELWDVADPMSPHRLATFPQPAGDVTLVSFTDDATTLAVGGQDGTLELWDLADPATPRHLASPRTAFTYGVYAATFTADGATLALTGGGDEAPALELWDTADPTSPRRLAAVVTGDTEGLAPFAFTTDGGTLATATHADGADGSVILWDLVDRAAPRRLGGALTGHTGEIRSVTFSHDGATLAVAGDTISFWDVADPAAPRRLLDLPPLESGSHSLGEIAFTADDTTLTMTSSYFVPPAQVVRWDMSRLVELRRGAVPIACQQAGGGLTPGEWERYIPDLPHQHTC
jgi:WD40 repeat protein